MWKRILLLLLTLCLLLGTVSCKKDEEQTPPPPSAAEEVAKVSVDMSAYAIAVASDNALALEAATELSEKLAANGMQIPLNGAAEKQIIIGNSEDADAKAAIAELNAGADDYIIKFATNKIIIAAKQDILLREACQVFLTKYIATAEGSTLTVAEGETTLAKAEKIAVLAENGATSYAVVFGDVSEDVKTKAGELVEALKTVAGVSNVTVGANYDASQKQIVIGQSGFAETAEALSKVKSWETAVDIVGNKVVVAGRNNGATMVAIDSFIALLNESKDISATGEFIILTPYVVTAEFCAELKDTPDFTGGTYKATYAAGLDNTQMYYTDVDKTQLDAFITQLEEHGYKKTEDRSKAGNRFVTCYGGENGLVHMTYLEYNKTLSVIRDYLPDTVYKIDEPEYTKVTENSLAVMSLDYTHKDNDGGNGMSYVITLEDGRFIVIDGGYMVYGERDAKDCNIIFNFLKDNNKRPDGKIVIAAWIFTHNHSDHIGAFRTFAERYSSQVDIEYIIYNEGDPTRYNQKSNEALETIVFPLMREKFPNVKRMIPHTGQVFKFCNVEFEVVSTQESHAPELFQWVNDASLILRMHINGITTLFTADAETMTTELLLEMYGDELKSDILQVNHHGYSGGTRPLFVAVAAKYALWPTHQASYDVRKTGKGNGNTVAQFANKWLASNVDRSFVADGDIEILTFVGGEDLISVELYTPKFEAPQLS